MHGFGFWFLSPKVVQIHLDQSRPNTGRMIREFGPYQKGVIGLDMYETRDKIMMAAALLTGEVLYIDFYAKQLVHTFQHPPYATSVKFSFEGDMIASTGQDGFVRLWDLKTKNQIRAFNHGAKVNTVLYEEIGIFILAFLIALYIHGWIYRTYLKTLGKYVSP
jgi:WD40 repeat protein